MAQDGLYDYEVVDDRKVILYFDDDLVRTLKGKEAVSFISKIEDLDDSGIQELIAKKAGKKNNGKPKKVRRGESYDDY